MAHPQLNIAHENINIKDNATVDVSERFKYSFLFSLSLLLFVLSFFWGSPGEIWEGSWVILKSPANLITDYFELANIGAALFNASVMSFISTLLLFLLKIKLTGHYIAAIFTVVGFSLFGKNLYNSFPIMLGVYGFARLKREPYNRYVSATLFGTALGPLVSEITFNLNLPLSIGIVLGVLSGVLVGIILPPMANHFMNFHQGFNMYNYGFTAGIIGMFFIGILRSFGVEVDTVSLISSGNNKAFAAILYSMFGCILLMGLFLNKWRFRGYGKLLKESGRIATDHVLLFGFGLTLINMALLGIICTSYVLAAGGELSGPVIGGIFTVVGYGAFGKHIKNVIPILAGIFLVSLINFYEISSAQALLAALFGTTLAPLCGYYGPAAGVLAGAMHMAMVMNIGYLHAGMNLYNNGFSGGFVAAGLVPVFNSIKSLRKLKKVKVLDEV